MRNRLSTSGTLEDDLPAGIAGEVAGKPGDIVEVEDLVKPRSSQITVQDYHPVAVLGQGYGQI